MSTTPSSPTPHDQAQLQAGALRVLKRNGRVVEYSDEKLALALSKAFQAVEGNSPAALEKIEAAVAEITRQVGDRFRQRMPNGGTLHIEDIQDQVELTLMRGGHQRVVRAYVLYRQARAEERARAAEDQQQ